MLRALTLVVGHVAAFSRAHRCMPVNKGDHRYTDGSMREKQLNIRLSPEEAARLEMVAGHYSLSAAAVLRMLVKREHDILVDAREARVKRAKK